ncbi:MAG: molecular chaperone [Armatimonadota bacterium]
MRRPETGTARTDCQAKAQEARQRSSVYHLLATLFAEEPSPALISALTHGSLAEALSSVGLRLLRDAPESHEQDAADSLALEYTRLFLGPGPHVGLYESLYRGRPESRHLWGEPAVRVKRFAEFLGLQFEADYGGIPDHLSVELEIMRSLTRREAEAWQAGELGAITWLLRHERRFLEEHLTRWVPRFCARVKQRASLDFYRQASALLQQFLTVDAATVRESLLTLKGTNLAAAAGGDA